MVISALFGGKRTTTTTTTTMPWSKQLAVLTSAGNWVVMCLGVPHVLPQNMTCYEKFACLQPSYFQVVVGRIS